MLNEFEWEEKKKPLVDFYNQKNELPKEEIEKKLRQMLVKESDGKYFNEIVASLSKKYSLSGRETDVLKEIADGKTNSQISESLSVSVSTVKKHIYCIFNKVGVNSRSQLLHLLYNM